MGKDHAVLAYQGYFSAKMVGQRLGPETGEIGHCTGDMHGAVKAALGREGRRLMAKFTRPGVTLWKSPVMSVSLSASRWPHQISWSATSRPGGTTDYGAPCRRTPTHSRPWASTKPSA
jgi:hypothetical protein